MKPSVMHCFASYRWFTGSCWPAVQAPLTRPTAFTRPTVFTNPPADSLSLPTE